MTSIGSSSANRPSTGTGTSDSNRTKATESKSPPKTVGATETSGSAQTARDVPQEATTAPPAVEERKPVSARVQADARVRAVTDPRGAQMRAALEGKLAAKALPMAVKADVAVQNKVVTTAEPDAAKAAAAPAAKSAEDAVKDIHAHPAATMEEQATRLATAVRDAPPDQRAAAMATALDHASVAGNLDAAQAIVAADPAVVDQADAIRETRELATDTAYKEISAATGQAEEAQAAVEHAENKLAAELADLGPALSPADATAYRENYWARDENTALKDTAAAATDALAATVAEHGEALDRDLLGATGQPGKDSASSAMTRAHEALAKDPRHAETVRDFVAKASDSSSPGASAYVDDRARLDGALATATMATANNVLARNGTPQEAYAAARAFLDPVAELADLGNDAGEALGALASGDASRVGDLADASASVKALGGVAALAGLASAVAAGSQGQWVDAFAKAAPGFELAASFLESAAAGVKNPSVGRVLGGVAASAEVMGKLGGALGGALGAAGDFATLMGPDGKPADGVAGVLGSLATVAAFVPGWGTAASVVLGTGAALSSMIADGEREQDVHDSKQEGLMALGMSEAAAEQLIQAGSSTLQSFADSGLPPSAIRGLAEDLTRIGKPLSDLSALVQAFPNDTITRREAESLRDTAAVMGGPDDRYGGRAAMEALLKYL